MAKKIKAKGGPKTVYERDETLTIRVSPLFKRLIAEAAARADVSAGDFVEHLGRTRSGQVAPDEFPAESV